MTPKPPKVLFAMIADSTGTLMGIYSSMGDAQSMEIDFYASRTPHTIVRYVPEEPDNDLELSDKASIEARLAELVKIQRAVKLRIDSLAVRHALFDRPMPPAPQEATK